MVRVVSVTLYIPLNFITSGNPIADAVTAIGLSPAANYYGLAATFPAPGTTRSTPS